jgi:hypothetical protein
MMTLMGQMGQQQDFAKGIEMLRLAAEHADENAPQGAYVLGMLQVRELPQVSVPESLLPTNEEQARLNIEKAAYLGFAKAQLKMGSAYELCTLGCEFDPALSLHYNSLAARQAEPEAEMAISKWFLCGYENVFPKNEELAYVYAERAALGGLSTAEFAMGYFNEIGMHVPVNIDAARGWYEKAALQGNTDAEQRIVSLKGNIRLSKKDHEKVAINRIKSQYGSRMGGRPERLSSNAPPLPPLPDNGQFQRPPRSSSTAPYPTHDDPNESTGFPPRSSSTAPYPLDNGPPRGGYGGPQQGQRTSGSAFMLNPALQQGGPMGRGDQYPPGRPQPGGYGPRPGDMGYNGGRGTSSPAPRVDSRLGGGRGGPNDYVAPLNPRRTPQPSPGPSPRLDSFPQGGPGGPGRGGPPGPSGIGGRPSQRRGGPSGPSPGPQGGRGAGRGAAGRGGRGGAAGLPPPKDANGNGPKTFAEMGIPQAQKEGDCVSLILFISMSYRLLT